MIGRAGNWLARYVSTETWGVVIHATRTFGHTCGARGVAAHAAEAWWSICGQRVSPCMRPELVDRNVKGRGVTLHVIQATQPAMWSTRCHRACDWNHANGYMCCHTAWSWLAAASYKYPRPSSHFNTSRPLQSYLKMGERNKERKQEFSRIFGSCRGQYFISFGSAPREGSVQVKIRSAQPRPVLGDILLRSAQSIQAVNIGFWPSHLRSTSCLSA